MGHRIESEGTRIIDGRVFKVTRLATGFGGRSISKDAFGGRKGARKGGSIGMRDSSVEKHVV